MDIPKIGKFKVLVECRYGSVSDPQTLEPGVYDITQFNPEDIKGLIKANCAKLL